MADYINFVKSDLDNVIGLEDLANHLTEVIQNIRKNSSVTLQLKEEIKKLCQIADTEQIIADKAHLIQLFQIYEQLQKVSLSLRTVLPKFGIEVEQYNTIEYSLYYQGHRQSINELRPEWLSVSGGELRLSVKHAVEDLTNEIQDDFTKKVNTIFDEHYQKYLDVIQGTYKGKNNKKIGQGGSGFLNLGHIAEAYEEHLTEHHGIVYNFLNQRQNFSLTSLDKELLQLEVDVTKEKQWSNHESVTEAWIHVRHSVGTQRGTVAGDVGNRQVKASKGREKRRLASITTLKEGVNIFGLILANEDEAPAAMVALKLAQYISEPIKQTASSMLNSILDKDIAEMFKDMDNILLNIKRQNIIVRI